MVNYKGFGTAFTVLVFVSLVFYVSFIVLTNPTLYWGDELCQQCGYSISTDMEPIISNSLLMECDDSYIVRITRIFEDCPIDKWGKEKCPFFGTNSTWEVDCNG